MTRRIVVNPNHLNRDEFLTPFDKIFDQLMLKQFPNFQEEVGVSFNQGAYPKVNVYEYDDKIGIVAEIPGLDKKDVTVDVEEGILTISGNKHGFDSDGGKCITRELKQSAFKRSFNLGEYLDGTKYQLYLKMVCYQYLFQRLNQHNLKNILLKLLND